MQLSGDEGVSFNRDGYGQIWDAVTGRPTSPLMAGTMAPTYTPAGDRLLTENDFLRSVRDAATGRERGSRLLAGGTTAFHPDGRTVLTSTLGDRALLWQVSAEAEPLAGRGTDPKASTTGSVANRRWRGYNAFRSGLLRADGQIGVSLADGAGGQELIRLSDPATGRSSGRPALHYPGWIVACGRLQPRRSMVRDREQSGRSPHRRAQTLERDHGPVAIPADSVHQLGRGTGIPARWQGSGRRRLRWTRPVLGSLDRPGDWPAASSRGDRSEPGLQPGRHDDRGGSRQRETASPAPGSGIRGRVNPSVNYCPAPCMVTRIEFRPDGRGPACG